LGLTAFAASPPDPNPISTPDRTNPVHLAQFQRLLSEPPVIREMLFLEKLPTEIGRPPSLEHGITTSTNFSIGLLSWQPGAMSYRNLSSTNVASETGIRGPAFFLYNDIISFAESPTNLLVYRMEHDRAQQGSFPPAYDAATYRLRRMGEPINLGLSHLLPGSVRWDGLRFQATGSADKKPIQVLGEISAFTQGIPSELRVLYTNAQVQARYRIAYSYSRIEPPWYPDSITLYFILGDREVEYRTYRILSVQTSSEPLPASHFDPNSYLPPRQTQISLATNDSTYLVLPDGSLLETPSGVSPRTQLSPSDYYRNRYAYVTMAAISIAFAVFIMRSLKRNQVEAK